MKRYWKTISLCIAAFIIIGTFYIQSSNAKENTKIEFEKVSGNQDEVNNLLLYASYRVGNLSQSLNISSKETTNLENQSLIQLLTLHNKSVLQQLVKEHKNFMRGKELLGNNFYEDEELLVYASIKNEDAYDLKNDFTFEIEVLNKRLNKTVSTQLDVPIKENYGWVDVVDVQVFDNELKIVTRGFETQGGNDLSVYSFELDGLKLVNNENIVSAPIVENGSSDIRIINDFYSIQPEIYLLIKIETYKDQEVEGDGDTVQHPDAGPELVANEVIVYNMQKNLIEKITVPEHLSIDSSSIFDSTIFIQSQSGNGIDVSQYDIEKKEWVKELSFDFLETKDGKEDSYIKLMEGRIYKVSSGKNEPTIYIGNLTTGKTLYEGKLKFINPRDGQMNGRLTIHEIEYIQ